MTRPTYAQWRNYTQPIPNTNVTAQMIWERALAALSTLASQQNPDGSPL